MVRALLHRKKQTDIASKHYIGGDTDYNGSTVNG